MPRAFGQVQRRRWEWVAIRSANTRAFEICPVAIIRQTTASSLRSKWKRFLGWTWSLIESRKGTFQSSR